MSNFQRLEAVGRGSETQLQVGDNINKITGLTLVLLGSVYILFWANLKTINLVISIARQSSAELRGARTTPIFQLSGTLYIDECPSFDQLLYIWMH